MINPNLPGFFQPGRLRYTVLHSCENIIPFRKTILVVGLLYLLQTIFQPGRIKKPDRFVLIQNIEIQNFARNKLDFFFIVSRLFVSLIHLNMI